MGKHNIVHHFITSLYFFLTRIVAVVIGVVIGMVGYWVFTRQPSPTNLIFGIPLISLSLGMVFHGMFKAFYTLFNPFYNKSVCILCKPERFKNHSQIKRVLGIK